MQGSKCFDVEFVDRIKTFDPGTNSIAWNGDYDKETRNLMVFI
jgi:hypothetical protein